MSSSTRQRRELWDDNDLWVRLPPIPPPSYSEEVVSVTEEVFLGMLDHARSTKDEVCGLAGFRDGVCDLYMQGQNIAKNPSWTFFLFIEPEAYLKELEGYDLAMFHSHPLGDSYPSMIDTGNIGVWADRLYLIICARTGHLGAYRIGEDEHITILNLRLVRG